MERILSGRCGASKVVDAAISDTQLWYSLLKTLPIAMTSREMVSTERDGDQRPWRDQRRLAALEKPREPR
jgi:hypothetical protein